MSTEDRARELLSAGNYKFRQGKISRRQFMSLMASCGIVVATPGLLSACGGSDEASETEQIRFLVGEAFWADWNPYGHTAQIGFKIQANLFDRLIEARPDLSLKPGLAKSWEQLDERTWEFKLRNGVKFHNGQSFSAQDVKASIELASGTNEKEGIALASKWVPHEVEVVDDFTVRLRGEKPFGPLLNKLTITDILSAEDLGKGIEYFKKQPNGTGPYRLADDKSNVKTLEAFEDYYRGPAKIKTVVWEYIQDSQTRLNALLSGQAAVIDRVEPGQVSTIEQRDDVEVAAKTSIEIQSFWFRQDKPPFGDSPALRRAVAWGVDREAMVNLIGGQADELAVSHLPADVLYHEPQEPQYTFDPERARAEMEAAGASPPIAFELAAISGFYPKAKEVSELAVENLAEVGFDVKLTVLELAAWIDMLFGEAKRGELFHGGWGNLTRDPDDSVSTLFHSPGGWTGADNKRTDELIERGRTTVDENEREQIYSKLQKHLWEQVPSVPINYGGINNGVDANLSGFEMYPNLIHKFWPVTIEQS